MQEKVRIYEMGRGNADNIKVIDKRLVLIVECIDLLTSTVIFAAGASIVEYENRRQSQSQSTGYEFIDDTRRFTMTPESEPKRIEKDGTVYTIAVVLIDKTQEQRSWVFCDFLVSWGE